MNGKAQAPGDLSPARANRGKAAAIIASLPEASFSRGPVVTDPFLPRAQGLYNPAREHDSCGVGFVADMRNRKSHDILEKGLQILVNLDHRGATGADAKLGDGCGVLVQIPHGFFAPECAKLGIALPEAGHYAIGQFFMPRDKSARQLVEKIIEEVVAGEGQVLLGWRDVPVDNSDLGERVKAVEPAHRQLFVGRGASVVDEDDFERKLFILRKVVSNRIYAAGSSSFAEYYPVSMSCRTVV
jgi:glutamate synthase (NADPH) large chain